MNKKLTIKSVIALLFISALTSLCLFGCGSSGTSTSASSDVDTGSVDTVVTVEIDPSAADGLVDLPAEDLAVVTEDVVLPDDSTAYDALTTIATSMEGTESYVTSINGLAEKAAGPSYGWMYEVNGEQPTVAANEYVVADGDVVRWYYGSWEE